DRGANSTRRDRNVHFNYIYSSDARGPVSVREGQAVVLLCGPPPHFGAPLSLSFLWRVCAAPVVLIRDNRRFVSQRTGNLYIAKVEASDVGNYTCVVKNMMTNATVFSSPTPVVLRRDGEGPEGCVSFILYRNPALQKPTGYKSINSSRDEIIKHLVLFHWLLHKPDSYQLDDLHWDCRANGKPPPVYRWLKNGHTLESQLRISKVSLEDSGMYQCLAKNEHSVIYASAELKVVASPPDFSRSPLKKSTLVQRGGEVIIECRPHASPRASFTWRRGGEILRDSDRYGWTVLEDGTLRITNVSEGDAGRYTCVARNPFGTASSSGTLVVKGTDSAETPPFISDEEKWRGVWRTRA
uniref:Ig-like domain-containing protein n=1 Tax=Astyanax mexicanus TaxID=7994 RepID=A0A3B1KJ58_ASTMX